MLHGQRHSGNDALAGFKSVARATDGVFGFNFPQNGFGPGQGKLGGSRHHPRYFTRFTSGNIHSLGLQFQQGRTRADFNLHGGFGCVAQGDLGAELVVLTHQRRQATDDLQVLRRLDTGLPGAEQACACIGNGHNLEGRQRVVQRHVNHRLTVGVQLHFGVPQQQRFKQLSGAAAPTTATCGHGLAAVMPAANDFHLRRRGFYAPRAALQHRFKQAPAVVGH